MSQRKISTKKDAPVVATNGHKTDQPAWGRFKGDFVSTVGCFLIILFTPAMALYFNIICEHFDCQFFPPLLEVFVYQTRPFSDLVARAPVITKEACMVFAVWYPLQILLALYFPGPTGYGQLTPAGNVLEYRVNGFRTWIISHLIFIIGSFYLGLFSPTIIYDNWGGLLILANIIGYILATFVYIKAHYFPTHAADRKFSGNFVYDYFMGIEFNPRIGDLDFKLFFNGRPGITAWTIINLSFAAAQYQKWGYVTNSMLIVNILHAVYVVDFFYNEDWYLRTIDIAHDHFGWMLAWGDSVWLPFTYTLQGYFLVTHPVELHALAALAILFLGFSGYFIFRSVNHQKDYFRAHDGKCKIWGKPAQYVDAKFVTSDGQTRSSKLLCSGWWGMSRHFNYVGDLAISTAYCLPCGFTHILPYEYIIFMTLLLIHRVYRDDQRCSEKYGPYWVEYKKRVPWKILPYVF